uniref:RING-type domain-containing protein n=1 Tax=Sinocyclocheilus rhinocerous TaxID=307959 RepID=A0A673II81_9TELE
RISVISTPNIKFPLGPLNEELQCSICLDVFTDPVTTPCGHNFCRTCLNKFWTNTQTCFCPSCKVTFSKRTDLMINTNRGTIMGGKVTMIQRALVREVDPGTQPLLGGTNQPTLLRTQSLLRGKNKPPVPLPRIRSLRGRNQPQLPRMQSLPRAQDYICQKHERPLELFCRDDQTSMCLSCTEGDHRTHNTVPIEEESREKKSVGPCSLSGRAGRITNHATGRV